MNQLYTERNALRSPVAKTWTVENCNRFVRRWYPKGTDFGKCTRGEMHKLEKVINSIHRKMFNGLTAYEYDTAYAASA